MRTLSLLLLLLSTSLVWAQSVPVPAALWRFDDPTDLGLDSAGSNDLTPVATPTAAGGALGYAADMEKDTAGYATIVDNSDFDPGAAGRGFCVWLRPETLTSNDYFLSKQGSLVANSDFNIFVSSGGVVILSFVDSSGAGSISVSSGTAFLSAGTRTFLCGWWDGGGDDKAHLEINSDANIKTGASTMTAANNGIANFYVAAISSQLGDYDGSVGPLIWYENGIPDVTIRAALYNSGKGKLCEDMTAADKTNAVACWDMTEDGGPYVDSIGSNDLTGINTPTRADGLVERSDSGISVNLVAASSQALTIVDNASLSLGADTPVCVAAWINPTSVSINQNFVGKGTGSTAPGIEYWLYAISGSMRFVVSDGTTFNFAEVAGLTANVWHLVIGCHDPVLDVVTLELDAVEDSTAHAIGTQDLTGTFAVGKSGSLNESFVSGAVDNVAIWKIVLADVERDILLNNLSWYKVARYPSCSFTEATSGNVVTYGCL